MLGSKFHPRITQPFPPFGLPPPSAVNWNSQDRKGVNSGGKPPREPPMEAGGVFWVEPHTRPPICLHKVFPGMNRTRAWGPIKSRGRCGKRS